MHTRGLSGCACSRVVLASHAPFRTAITPSRAEQRRCLWPVNVPCLPAQRTEQPRNSCRRQLQVTAAASGAAAFNIPSQQEVRQKAANRIKSPIPKPAQLPPPPKSTSLLDVLPYLTKLAVSDAQLYWRLGLAFVLMIASKAAGTAHSPAWHFCMQSGLYLFQSSLLC